MSFYDNLKFDANGLIPTIVQEQSTGRVVMMAWMNRASLEKNHRHRQNPLLEPLPPKFWMKGEESGHTQTVKDIASIAMATRSDPGGTRSVPPATKDTSPAFFAQSTATTSRSLNRNSKARRDLQKKLMTFGSHPNRTRVILLTRT